jgi:hypothetical protein
MFVVNDGLSGSPGVMGWLNCDRCCAKIKGVIIAAHNVSEQQTHCGTALHDITGHLVHVTPFT